MTLCGHMSRLKRSTVVFFLFIFFTQSLAAALVRSKLVALNAPALEPPLRVGTALAAVAFFGTLVHIWNGPWRGWGGTRGEGQREMVAGLSMNSRHKAKCSEVAEWWFTPLLV